MVHGENGNYSEHGFRASEVYYAMTGREPEIYGYRHKRVKGEFVLDFSRPIYKIDRLDIFQQELILDGLQPEYSERLKKLSEFHASKKREDDERYQNFIRYMEQKSKSNTDNGSQQCLPLF